MSAFGWTAGLVGWRASLPADAITYDGGTVADALAANEAAAASAQATLDTLTGSDREVPLWPFDGIPQWQLRGTAITSGLLCNNKNALVQWQWLELAAGIKNQAVIRVGDTAGFDGLLVRAFFVSAGVTTNLGNITSAGNGTTQDLVLEFLASVEGPGMFRFEALTPNPIGPSGSYTITRCRIQS